MRASRLVSLLMLLQARGRLTAAQLAHELEVSVRTIYRDVGALAAAGVPLYGDAGPDGGYRLIDGYRTRLTGLTGDEAEVMLLGGLPGPAADLGLSSALAAAQRKLLAALPVELRDRARLVRERFHLDAPGWYRDAESLPHLGAVAEAVWQQRSLRVTYRRWRAPTDVTRVVDPLGLILKAGRWYVVARCAGDVRTYRVAQILDLERLTTRFDRPDGFELAAYWRRYLAEFEARRYRGYADVRLSPRGVERLAQLMDPAVVAAMERNAVADHDGWVRTRVPIEKSEHALAEMLRLGAEVEVLTPPELRRRIATVAAAMVRVYEAEPRGICAPVPDGPALACDRSAP
jgi:predicted DNA-binding transcriptional regulator YafY